MLRIVFSKVDEIFEHLIKFNISRMFADETVNDGYERSVSYYNIIPNDQMNHGLSAIVEGISIEYIYKIPTKEQYVIMYDSKNQK